MVGHFTARQYEIHRPARTLVDGRVVDNLQLVATVAGRLSPMSGADQLRADQERGVVTLRFSTDAQSDVKVNDVVRDGVRSAQVKAVRTTSTGRRKECVCEEIN